MSLLFSLTPGSQLLDVNEQIVLQGYDGFRVIQSADHGMVLRAIGSVTRTIDELFAATSITDINQLRDVLGDLVASDLVNQSTSGLSPNQLVLWDSLSIPPEKAILATHSYSVNIVSNEIDERVLISAVNAWGFSTGNDGTPFTILVCDDPFSKEVQELNRLSLEKNSPWCLLIPSGQHTWLSFFDPSATACSACLASRLAFNQPARTIANSIQVPAGNITYSVSDAICSAFALYASSAQYPAWTNCWTKANSTNANIVESFPFDRLPECPDCGEMQKGQPPWNRDRSVQLDYRRMINPVTGIAREIRFLESVEGLYATALRYRFAANASTVPQLISNESHVAGGKGWSREGAAISACGEVVERISGCYRPDLTQIRSSARKLGESALCLQSIDQFSEAQQQNRHENAELSALTVPVQLDPDLKTGWVRAWKLGSDAEYRWFPTAAAYYGYPFESDRFAVATSNGCAAGRTPQHAATNGILELIERDAAAIWWYNKIRRPALDIDAFESTRLSLVRSALIRKGRTLDLVDITTDLLVPVVVAISRRRDGSPGWTLGLGAGPNHLVAATRAVGEIGQLIGPTDNPEQPNPTDWVNTASVDDQPQLEPENTIQPIRENRFSDLDSLHSLLCRLDLESYVIDQTHPMVGVPVVRTLVPGLVHFWRRLGARRLYDVPVQMNWLTQPKTEATMNNLDLTI